MNLKEELELRGYVHQFTDEELFPLFEKGWQVLYFWVDPAVDSMQLWNFVALMNAFHFMKRWNKLILLAGWSTGMIWNPSGKEAERKFLDEETAKFNAAAIAKQLWDIAARISKNLWGNFEIEVVNNYDFVKDMNIVQFLREVGKFVTVNWMMNKDIVKKRITDPDKSISFAEFSYMLLMWYDYYCLYKDKGVRLEVWGSDEWDGILAWLEIIGKKIPGAKAYGMTNKLIMDSNGKKFGKSEGNAIWLDKNKNSPYFVYQYFLNMPDADIERFLKLLTFLDFNTINQIVEEHNKAPHLRFWQKRLAKEVLTALFWEEEAFVAETISNILFGEGEKASMIDNMDNTGFSSLIKEAGFVKFEKGKTLADYFIEAGLIESKSEWRKLAQGGGLSLNDNKVDNLDTVVDSSIFGSKNYLVIRKWKKNFKFIVK